MSAKCRKKKPELCELNVSITVDILPRTPENQRRARKVGDILMERIADFLPEEQAAELRLKVAQTSEEKPA